MKSLKQRILEEMLIDDEFAYDLAKQLYLSGRLKPEYEGLSFELLYNEVKGKSKNKKKKAKKK